MAKEVFESSTWIKVIFSCFCSGNTSQITEVAPKRIALSINEWPSTETPLWATNNEPSFNALESKSIWDISKLVSP